MRAEDIAAMELHFTKWAEELKDVKNIGLLSPSHQEVDLLKRLFPDAWQTVLSQRAWNLNNPGTENFDLIVACNVFLCADDPDLWFRNVLDRCRRFWIQDNIRAWRRDECELGGRSGDDNDIMRYSMPPDHVARIDNSYDLRRLSESTLNFVAYPAPGRPNLDSEAFLMNLQGKL